MTKGKVNFLIDVSIGSTGKGNVSAYLASKTDFDLCIGNNGPNSGHSIVLNDETKVVKMVPVCGIINEKSNVLMGSGSVINTGILLREIEEYNLTNRLLISAYAPVINEACIEYEKKHLQYIASTFQGTGAAIGLKAMRSQDIKLVKDYPELDKYCHKHMADVIINRIGTCGYTALCEISQGYGLTIDNELYPFTTSRCVNVGQAVAYLDIPTSLVGDIVGVARTYPIRVGNVPNGYSGDTYFDSKEITWDEMSQKLGRKVIEHTSVTKRVRRVFTFSKYLFEMAVRRNGVNILFLTFCDYLTPQERSEFVDYLTSSKFNFREIYFVSGFWNWDKNIERIK